MNESLRQAWEGTTKRHAVGEAESISARRSAEAVRNLGSVNAHYVQRRTSPPLILVVPEVVGYFSLTGLYASVPLSF